MTTFTATKYFADQPIPASPNPGTLLFWDDTFITTAAGVVLTTGDSVKMVRMPAGHKPTKLQIYSDGDPDTGGTSLAVNIGTTADADLLAHAFTDIPALLAHARKLEEEVAEYEGQHSAENALRVMNAEIAAERDKWRDDAIEWELENVTLLADRDTFAKQRDALAARVAELEAVVGRLEKTNDGVPLAPGDHAWVLAQDQFGGDNDVKVIECKYADPTDPESGGWMYESVDRDNDWESFHVLSVWSTSEAAAAALAATNPTTKEAK